MHALLQHPVSLPQRMLSSTPLQSNLQVGAFTPVLPMCRSASMHVLLLPLPHAATLHGVQCIPQCRCAKQHKIGTDTLPVAFHDHCTWLAVARSSGAVDVFALSHVHMPRASDLLDTSLGTDSGTSGLSQPILPRLRPPCLKSVRHPLFLPLLFPKCLLQHFDNSLVVFELHTDIKCSIQ
jgi:hypothetical protein